MNEVRTELDLVKIYAQAWNTLDCEKLRAYLSEDVVYESQNVFTPLVGKEKLLQFLRAKMNNIKNTGQRYKVFAEIGYLGSKSINNTRLLDYRGRPVIVMAQGSRNSPPIAVVLLEVRHDGMITRVDICSVAPHPSSALRTGEYPE